MKKRVSITENDAQAVVVYDDVMGTVEIRANVQRDTVWATQAQISEIFGVERSVITKHIKTKSWSNFQYVQNLHILPTMAKYTKCCSIILM